MITVGVVDDELLVRSGLRSVLEHAKDVQVVGEAGNGAGAVELARQHQPRVIMMDIRMPVVDGVVATERIHKVAPSTAVILLTATATEDQVRRGIRAGVAGFLLKNGNPQELLAAVRAAAIGEAVVSPAVTRRLLDRIAALEEEPLDEARALVEGLTKREKEVLALLAQGLGNQQIGRRLYVSEGAIKAHISKVLTKMNCDNRVQAAIIAFRARLTTV
jgi:DNA-binding NarL/FixJ family response regulator